MTLPTLAIIIIGTAFGFAILYGTYKLTRVVPKGLTGA